MPINKKFSGTLLLNDTFQRICPLLADDTIRTDRWTEGDIFLHELTAGDQIQIKFDKYDEAGQDHRSYDLQILFGDQNPVPTFHLGAVIDSWLRIEVKQTLAPLSYKTINFKFYEVVD
jgi:hypothetical protein